ncbi:remorin-like protein [Hordeum vulgare]|uniref:Remorin C-terminal domain-containing protein n=1 Tax=Hordeum vulgare subsp. vulgare TaxID=112509 RepID=A0A8I6WQQ4_HORVV|nr:remorin 4.1-like [Hordeum vulgare subsp. vulgare]KAE8775523.1 remorin-like protein [Hordeum vulgare]
MLSGQTAVSGSSSSSIIRGVEQQHQRRPIEEGEEEEPEFRDIHALSPPRALSLYRRSRPGSRDSWGSAAGAGGSRHTSIRSVGSDTAPSELFPTMSREFSAMVAAAASANASSSAAAGHGESVANEDALGRIGEEELEETNPLAIVPDSNPIPSPRRGMTPRPVTGGEVVVPSAGQGQGDEVSVGQVKKDEVETKIAAWQIAEVAKVNNRFKREEVVINGWEGDQVEKASAWLNKYERKLEEKRAKAMEKAQNEVARARRKAEDKRASAEAKRGTKVARVLELANFMRAVGRAPTKRSFF